MAPTTLLGSIHNPLPSTGPYVRLQSGNSIYTSHMSRGSGATWQYIARSCVNGSAFHFHQSPDENTSQRLFSIRSTNGTQIDIASGDKIIRLPAAACVQAFQQISDAIRIYYCVAPTRYAN